MEQIEKAKETMEGVEIEGRKLRVRRLVDFDFWQNICKNFSFFSSKDTDKKNIEVREKEKREERRNKGSEHEIYIGNYPVQFGEADVRKLFEDHGVNVGAIRLFRDGLKV